MTQIWLAQEMHVELKPYADLLAMQGQSKCAMVVTL